MKRLATLVGCNYPNLKPELQLHGCINDVNAMKPVLMSRFGFAEADIQVLTDDTSSKVKPTGVNIMQALNSMIDKAVTGDVLYFYFSGHGTRYPKPTDASKFDEAIVPSDLNLITEIDIGELVDRVPSGATFTFLADSCNSGGLMYKEKEQIGPSHDPSTKTSNARKPKFIPLEAIVEYLRSSTGSESSDIGTLSYAAFGDKASISFSPEALERSKRLGGATPDVGILLSACQADENAGEADFAGTTYSIFSQAVQTAFKWIPLPFTNKALVIRAREILQEEGFTEQHPCLYCSDEHAGTTFLKQPEKPSS